MSRSINISLLLLLIAVPVLAACSSQSSMLQNSTPRPIPTRIGVYFNTATPPAEPTLAPLPTEPYYDPLRHTQTAQAALPTATAVAPTLTPSATPVGIPTGTLAGGILGLIPTQQGLWAMRGDGSQLTLITSDPIDRLAVTNNGRLAAYVTHINPGNYYAQPYGYLIRLITLYNGKIYDIASIDPPWLSAESSHGELEAAANAIAAYARGALAWSPGGTYLAFTSSHEAPPGQPASSDVYLYAPTSGRITRQTHLELPEGAAHAYDIQWSRDTRYFYYAAAYSFGFGSAPTRTAGAWIAGLDGSLAQVDASASSGPVSLGEDLIAWLPGPAVLISTRTPGCAEGYLRSIAFRSGVVSTLWQGCYADMVYSRTRDEVLVSVSPREASISEGLDAGLYRIRRITARPEKISEQYFEKLYGGDTRANWYGYHPELGLSAIQNDGTITPTFTGAPYDGSTGEVLTPLDRLPRSGEWLWESRTSGEVLLGSPGQSPIPLFDLQPSGLTSSPTNPDLYFFIGMTENGPSLYGMRAGEWKPYLVDPRIQNPLGVIWTA